ncbi:MAG: glutamate racemase [Alphaproteobacteria bacterium]|nr:glutamate racemase [Alphaproteobacteria bacterium]
MTRALVFDSGVGGLSVLDAMLDTDRDWRIDYLADTAWLPYGEKADADLVARVPALIEAVAAEWAPEVVVIACNTASTIALDAVRARLPVPVVGVVPPIKPAAAASVSGVIGVLATPATVQRPYTDDLIARFAAGCTVIRVGTTVLVAQAEAKARGQAVDLAAVRAAIAPLFEGEAGARLDVVALACTHFPLLRDELIAAAPRAVTWLDSGAAVARRAADVAHAPEGAPRVRRIGLTAPGGFRELAPALSARGFDAFAAVRDRPPFDLDVWRSQSPA